MKEQTKILITILLFLLIPAGIFSVYKSREPDPSTKRINIFLDWCANMKACAHIKRDDGVVVECCSDSITKNDLCGKESCTVIYCNQVKTEK